MDMKLTFTSLSLILLQLGSVVSQLQHRTAEQKWDLLLKTIGAKGLQVTRVTDDKIFIKTNLENLKHLRKLLDSPDVMQKNTLHALFCDNPKPPKGNYTMNSINIKDNLWFKRVVSDEFIKKNGLSEVFDAMRSNVKYDGDLLTMTMQFTLPDIIPYLMLRLSLTKLQSAVTDEATLAKILTGQEPPVTAHSNTSPTKFARIISKIISDEDNYTIKFIVNNGAFAQTLQAAVEDGEAPIIATDLNGSFVIDKQYLLKYLTPLFNGLVWSEKDKIPIVFNAKRPESSSKDGSHDINMLIDTSGSMYRNFAAYKSNIKEILDQLENIPNWQIQMVRFSTFSYGKLFSFKTGSTIDDVKSYVDTFTAVGLTRLYCTVQESLVDIRKKLANTLDLYSTLIVFTDGDNNRGCEERDVISAASYLKIIPQFNMYAVGFGQTQSGFQNFFKRISEEGGFIHIKLDDPSGMTQLRQYIDIITQKIDIWEILQGELKLSVARVPQGDVFILDPATKSDVKDITFVKNYKDTFKLGMGDIHCTSDVRKASIIY